MTNFNEWTNTLLYKNISLTLYSRKGRCWLCVRGELETRTDCYILTQNSSDHSSTSFSSWLGCSTVGHWGPKALCLPLVLMRASCPPTDSNWKWPKPSVAPGYIIVLRPPTSTVPLLIYTGVSLDWRLSRGSIYNTSRSCWNSTTSALQPEEITWHLNCILMQNWIAWNRTFLYAKLNCMK